MDTQWKQRGTHHGSHWHSCYEDKNAFAVDKGSGNWFIFTSHSCHVGVLARRRRHHRCPGLVPRLLQTGSRTRREPIRDSWRLLDLAHGPHTNMPSIVTVSSSGTALLASPTRRALARAAVVVHQRMGCHLAEPVQGRVQGLVALAASL